MVRGGGQPIAYVDYLVIVDRKNRQCMLAEIKEKK